MDIYYDPIYTNGIDDKSRFPKERYQLIYNEIVNSNYKNYINFIQPEEAKINDILLAPVSYTHLTLPTILLV